jgi:prevent-host-death family protein
MTRITSTDAQKSFGRIIDQAVAGDAVVVERYGQPRVVIVDYGRYRELVEAEREALRDRLRAASTAVSARAAGLRDEDVNQLIEVARREVQTMADDR